MQRLFCCTLALRRLLAILVNSGFSKQTIELLIEKSIDDEAVKCGQQPVVDVWLLDCKNMLCDWRNYDESKEEYVATRQHKAQFVGVENGGNGRIICHDRQQYAPLLRNLSHVTLRKSAGLEAGARPAAVFREAVGMMTMDLGMTAMRT